MGNQVLPIFDELSETGFDWESCLRRQSPKGGLHGSMLRELECLDQTVRTILINTADWIEHKVFEKKLNDNARVVDGNPASIPSNLRKDLLSKDPQSYRSALEELKQLEQLRYQVHRRRLLLDKLNRLPQLRQLIQERAERYSSSTPPGTLEGAWRHRRLEAELDRRSSWNINDLQSQLEVLRRESYSLVNQLIEKRTWRGRF